MKAHNKVIPINRDNSTMQSNLPDPLTPPAADLSGFEWMELNIHRLFRSEMWAKATGDEFRAALKLWGESFWEKPAGSLPDDDVLLARLADYGRDVKGFESVKAMVMRGWIKCSDGRLYHPVVAETVLKAWAERLKYKEKQQAERDRKAAYRESLKDKSKACPSNVPRDTSGTQAGHDADFRSKTETETETETETGNNIFIYSGADEKASDPKPTERKQPPSAKKQKTTLPPDFDISPQVQAWADQNGHTQLAERLENFKLAAERNGYQYADWDAAFKTAVRDDWAKLKDQQERLQGNAIGQRGGIHSGFDKIDYTRGINPDGSF
jgi:hypothetical protein